MGNKNSTGTIEPSISSYPSHNDDTAENPYSRPPIPPHHRVSPLFPKRSYTVIEKPKTPDTYTNQTVVPPPLIRTGSTPSVRPTSIITTGSSTGVVGGQAKTDSPPFDDVADHVVDTTPKSSTEDVPLGASIVVMFDKDIRTININKLFEVSCESPDQGSSTIKGQGSYDGRQMKAEFVPQNTLFPNSKITVRLNGKAITTSHCSQSINIKDMSFTFHTSNPPPKTVGIRLKDQSNTEQLQIANYYDLYNSLINWSSRKWGCSGEHVTGLYSEKDGKLLPLKFDQDILNVKDDEVIVIEIKD